MSPRNAAKTSAKPTSRITNALKSYLFDGILLVALGLVLLLLPKVSLTILCVIIGVALIIMGLIKLIFFAANVNGVRRIADIPVGIIQLVLGFWLIFDSSLFINLFQISLRTEKAILEVLFYSQNHLYFISFMTH